MKKYEHIISLGYFCSTAQEIERIGLRDCSSPFDWLISSDFHMVIDLIKNNFKDFLKMEHLYQSRENPSYYCNVKYQIWFYHDFNGYESLQKQLPLLQAKYKRRVENFYKNITEPTLFIRYISNEDELSFIENNMEKIDLILKEFNSRNEILYVSNNDLKSNKITAFCVEADPNDSVARKFLDKNNELLKYLNEVIIYDKCTKEMNLNSYKQKKKYSKFIKGYFNFKNKIKILLCSPYHHYQKYN